jgi:predicted amidophosphoribosyltransferase
MSYDDLLEITEVDPGQLRTPVRPEIVLFDDVLTSGKHYKAAKTRLRGALPNHPLIGLFVARANHPSPFQD